jgi:hypothetical protein
MAMKSLNVSKAHIDLVDKIIVYESGEMNDHDTIEFFAELVKSGMAWSLQGSYGRTATALIEAGYLDRKGNLTAKGRNI